MVCACEKVKEETKVGDATSDEEIWVRHATQLLRAMFSFGRKSKGSQKTSIESAAEEALQRNAAPAAESPRSSTEEEREKVRGTPLRFPSAKHLDPEVDVLGDLTDLEMEDKYAKAEKADVKDDHGDGGDVGGKGGGKVVKKLARDPAMAAAGSGFDSTDLPGGGANALGRVNQAQDMPRSAQAAGSWSWALLGPGFPEMHDTEVAYKTAAVARERGGATKGSQNDKRTASDPTPTNEQEKISDGGDDEVPNFF